MEPGLGTAFWISGQPSVRMVQSVSRGQLWGILISGRPPGLVLAAVLPCHSELATHGLPSILALLASLSLLPILSVTPALGAICGHVSQSRN